MKTTVSHPAWVCGLKHGMWMVIIRMEKVTPCVGVWIGTTASCRACITPKSHPAWVCGLKHLPYSPVGMCCWSHPAWVCGLKQ